MIRAYLKDILRSIIKNGKRFASLAAITALGVTVLTGIYATCLDLYRSSDRFYDSQELFDVRVLSTLGLTDDDMDVLRGVPGVSQADGGYSEVVYTSGEGGQRQTAEVIMLGANGLSKPFALEGRLPEKGGEIAVSQKYIDKTGKKIGDRLEIEEKIAASGGETDDEFDLSRPETPNFRRTSFTITGVALDPASISRDDGGAAFRYASAADYAFFVTSGDVESEIYTEIRLSLGGLAALDCHGEEYKLAVAAVIQDIESSVMKAREQARYDDVKAEALEKLDDAEAEMNEKFGEAELELEKARRELEDAKRELADGQAELDREEQTALDKLADARREIEDGKRELKAAEAELSDGEALLLDGAAQIEAGRLTLEAQRAEAEELPKRRRSSRSSRKRRKKSLSLFHNKLK